METKQEKINRLKQEVRRVTALRDFHAKQFGTPLLVSTEKLDAIIAEAQSEGISLAEIGL